MVRSVVPALAGLALFVCGHALAAEKISDADAFAELKARAQRGDAISQWAVSQAYSSGQYGLKADKAEAFKWASKAADGGIADAAFNLAHAYEKGEGTTADPAQAADWLQKAANAGSAPAAVELGGLYEKGQGGLTRNAAQADALYQTAYNLGDRDVWSHLCASETAGDGVDWTRAPLHCQKAGQAGDDSAWLVLANAYASGTGLTADPAKALDAYRAAANGGSLPAMEALAAVYHDGTLAPKDENQALNWHRNAARYGSMPAVAALARAYDSGDGVEADPKEAARLYDILARSGDTDAKAWFAAHPKVRQADIQRDIVTPGKMPSGQILYAIDSDDPRFQTLDLASYYQQLVDTTYPQHALQEHKEGAATVECRFTAHGDLNNCILVEESPRSYGFGPALARIADRLSDSGNKALWADRYAGKTLRLSARWKP
ncbi:tetratricopeptide repeat protein [Asticcacaulis solisilvae]|uniref:tetratricopeptide repeat protein n=1 Tax=Asticcacaulis solisilvae TaxID=1217274 RepID=UPI003FD7F9B8